MKSGVGRFGGPDREEERGGWVGGYLGLGLVGVGEQGRSRVTPSLEAGWLGAGGPTGEAGACRSVEPSVEHVGFRGP